MKKIFGSLSLIGILVFSRCSDSNQQTTVSSSNSTANEGIPQASNEVSTESSTGNAAIIYYSLTGTTEAVATEIQLQTDAEIFALATATDYPTAYTDVAELVRQQQADGELPELTPLAIDLADYDTIYLGSPIWFGSTSLPVQQWLSENNLSEKTIRPFFTSGSSGIGSATGEIECLATEATVTEGLGIPDATSENVSELVTAWLEEN